MRFLVAKKAIIQVGMVAQPKPRRTFRAIFAGLFAIAALSSITRGEIIGAMIDAGLFALVAWPWVSSLNTLGETKITKP